MTEYAKACTTSLVEALNNPGALQAVTKALTAMEIKATGGANSTEIPTLARYTMRVRQLTAMQASRITLKQSGNTVYDLKGFDIANILKQTVPVLGWGRRQKKGWLPHDLLAPLHEIGVTSIRELIEPETWRLWSLPEMSRRYPRLMAKHKRAYRKRGLMPSSR